MCPFLIAGQMFVMSLCLLCRRRFIFSRFDENVTFEFHNFIRNSGSEKHVWTGPTDALVCQCVSVSVCVCVCVGLQCLQRNQRYSEYFA